MTTLLAFLLCLAVGWTAFAVILQIGYKRGVILYKGKHDTTQHIAAIVKGLLEAGDGTKHFGSLLDYQHHLHEAVKADLVQIIDGKTCVTQIGVQYYDEAKVEAAIEALEKELAQQDLLCKAATKAIEVLEEATNHTTCPTSMTEGAKQLPTTSAKHCPGAFTALHPGQPSPAHLKPHHGPKKALPDDS